MKNLDIQSWLPNNICEFFFYDENGDLSINEERVKTLYYEFTSVMKSVHGSVAKKYQDVVGSIIVEPELDEVDFPLVITKISIEGLKAYLSPELA